MIVLYRERQVFAEFTVTIFIFCILLHIMSWRYNWEPSTQQFDFKLILNCLIFGLFYLHPTTYFNLQRSSSRGLWIHMSSFGYLLLNSLWRFKHLSEILYCKFSLELIVLIVPMQMQQYIRVMKNICFCPLKSSDNCLYHLLWH